MKNINTLYRVLCVDEDRLSCDNIASGLELSFEKVKVYKAQDVSAAFDILKTTKIDLIICEIYLAIETTK